MAEGDRAALADGVLSVREACDFSKLSKTEIYVLMKDGRLAFVKHGKRRLIPKRALVELLAGGLVGGGDAGVAN